MDGNMKTYNYMTSLMQFLGMALLLCEGIAVLMSDIVSGECTPATLKFLLVQPVTGGKVLLSKFISSNNNSCCYDFRGRTYRICFCKFN